MKIAQNTLKMASCNLATLYILEKNYQLIQGENEGSCEFIFEKI